MESIKGCRVDEEMGKHAPPLPLLYILLLSEWWWLVHFGSTAAAAVQGSGRGASRMQFGESSGSRMRKMKKLEELV